MDRLKKIILPALAFIFFTSAASAEIKSDAYIGGGIGVTNSTYTLTSEVLTMGSANVTDAAYLTGATTNFEGTIFAGYGINWSQWYYLGVQVGGSAGRRRAFLSSIYSNPTSQDTVNTDVNIKLNSYELDVDLRPGIYVQHNTLLYGIIGAAFNKLKVISSTAIRVTADAGSTTFEKSVRDVNLRLGFGFQKYLAHSLSLFFDYIYTNYKTLGTGGHQICNGGACTFYATSKAGAKDKTFLVGIIYHFLNPVSSDTGSVTNNWSDGFNGFYLGAQGGLSLMIAKGRYFLTSAEQGTAIPITSTLLLHPHSTDGIGGLFLGFSHLWNRFYFGLEAGSDYSDQRTRASVFISDFPNTGGPPDVENATSSTDVKLGPISYFFDIKPGFLLTKNTALYLRMGVGVNRIRTFTDAFVEDIDVGDITQGMLNLFSKKFKAGLRVGIGVEGMITHYLSLRADYIFSHYGTFGDSGSNVFVTNTGVTKGRTNLSNIYTQTVLAGMAFHFG